MAGYNHLLTMTFSAIREIIGVTEMGRKSPKEAGLATLGTAVTNPIFQLVYIQGVYKSSLTNFQKISRFPGHI